MLMFAKTSSVSFIYNVIDIFVFPSEKVNNFYSKHRILKCLPYLILTDTDSAATDST